MHLALTHRGVLLIIHAGDKCNSYDNCEFRAHGISPKDWRALGSCYLYYRSLYGNMMLIHGPCFFVCTGLSSTVTTGTTCHLSIWSPESSRAGAPHLAVLPSGVQPWKLELGWRLGRPCHHMPAAGKTNNHINGSVQYDVFNNTGMILGLRPANERLRYFVMTSLIGWAQA